MFPTDDLPSAQAFIDLKTASGIYKHNSRMMDEIIKVHHLTVSPDLGETYEGVSGVCDSTDVEMMFQLVYFFFEHPRFDRKDFDLYVYFNRTQVREMKPTVNDTINKSGRTEIHSP